MAQSSYNFASENNDENGLTYVEQIGRRACLLSSKLPFGIFL